VQAVVERETAAESVSVSAVARFGCGGVGARGGGAVCVSGDGSQLRRWRESASGEAEAAERRRRGSASGRMNGTEMKAARSGPARRHGSRCMAGASGDAARFAAGGER